MSAPQYQGGSGNGAKAGLTAGLIVAILAGVGCVGIFVIGILAAIAIPNFLKFQCLSKQSEAKTNLAGLFTAEKAFYGEYGFYTSDLVSVSWTPDGSPLYVYGFHEAGPDEEELPRSIDEVPRDYDPSRKDTANAAVSDGSYSTMKMTDLQGKTLSGSDLPADTYADESGFVAGAVGDIDTDAGFSPGYDVWTIDEKKTLIAVENDCTN